MCPIGHRDSIDIFRCTMWYEYTFDIGIVRVGALRRGGDGNGAGMKMPWVLETMQCRCGDSGENPVWMLEMECACHMLYAFIGFERIPVFRFDIHVGKYSLELV